MVKETWKAAPGYEGVYEVSDLGRVRRLWTKGYTRILKPWLTRQSKRQGGRDTYLRVELSRVDEATGEKLVRRFNLHTLVWQTFKGPVPPGMQINHRDLNKCNAALANLDMVTPAENIAHFSANRKPKVSLAKQALMRELAPTTTRLALAKRFKVSASMVHKIVGDIPAPATMARAEIAGRAGAIRAAMKARDVRTTASAQAVADAHGVSLLTAYRFSRLGRTGPKRKPYSEQPESMAA